jgi:hypothetical protein
MSSFIIGHVIELLLISDDGQTRPFLRALSFAMCFCARSLLFQKSGRAHFRVHRLYFTLLLIAVKETSIDARRAS